MLEKVRDRSAADVAVDPRRAAGARGEDHGRRVAVELHRVGGAARIEGAGLRVAEPVRVRTALHRDLEAQVVPCGLRNRADERRPAVHVAAHARAEGGPLAGIRRIGARIEPLRLAIRTHIGVGGVPALDPRVIGRFPAVDGNRAVDRDRRRSAATTRRSGVGGTRVDRRRRAAVDRRRRRRAAAARLPLHRTRARDAAHERVVARREADVRAGLTGRDIAGRRRVARGAVLELLGAGLLGAADERLRAIARRRDVADAELRAREALHGLRAHRRRIRPRIAAGTIGRARAALVRTSRATDEADETDERERRDETNKLLHDKPPLSTCEATPAQRFRWRGTDNPKWLPGHIERLSKKSSHVDR